MELSKGKGCYLTGKFLEYKVRNVETERGNNGLSIAEQDDIGVLSLHHNSIT
jgi:hypothetical protein